MTTYYRPARDERNQLVVLVLTPEASQPVQTPENFGNSVAVMKAYMAECYGEVEMASPVRWQREIEARRVHTPEMVELLGEMGKVYDLDITRYIVYAATSRPIHGSWADIPGSILIQQSDKEQRVSKVYTYVAVPSVLSTNTIEHHDLTYVSCPANDK